LKTRKWTSQQKFLIVLEGIKAKTISEICSDHGIHQSLYYKWKDRFLKDGHTAFNKTKPDKKNNKLKQENLKLKQLVGELTLELKKNEGMLS